ncbi:MAG: hypothetical protein AAF195_04065 [Pseudomonadota bacterium]
MRKFFKNNNFCRGISLVETGIVMGVVAVLSVVLITASNVQERAKNDRMFGEIKEIQQAIVQFKKEFGHIPGDIDYVDMNNGDTNLYNNMVNGNGDNIITNDSQEELLFWYHLYMAELYNFNMAPNNNHKSRTDDGSGMHCHALLSFYWCHDNGHPNKNKPLYDTDNQFVVALNNRAGSIPPAPIENSGFRVSYSQANGFFIDVANISKDANNNVINSGVMTPEELYNLDKKLDDGIANSGKILAINDGASNCITGGGEYNISNDDKTCIIRFALRNKFLGGNNVGAGSISSCGHSNIGAKTISSSSSCPDGTRGNVVNICRPGGGGAIESYEECKPVTCNNAAIGTTRNVACPETESGNVIEICSDDGTWDILDDSNCVASTIVGESCNEDLYVACPLGKKGYKKYSCNSGILSTLNNNCTTMKCGSKNIGTTKNNNNCDSTYYSGKITKLCTYDRRSGHQYKTIAHNCQLKDLSCSGGSEGNIREIGCPEGEIGAVEQICSSGNWILQSNSCKPITCADGSRLGDYKISTQYKCPDNLGKVIEVCAADSNGTPTKGIWYADYTNCVN